MFLINGELCRVLRVKIEPQGCVERISNDVGLRYIHIERKRHWLHSVGLWDRSHLVTTKVDFFHTTRLQNGLLISSKMGCLVAWLPTLLFTHDDKNYFVIMNKFNTYLGNNNKIME